MSKKEKTSKSKIQKKKQKEKRENKTKTSISTPAFSGRSDYNVGEGQSQTKERMVEILDAVYNNDLGIIVFQVKAVGDEEGKVFRMTARFSDIKQAYNINAEVPPYLIHKFCKDLIGKQKNVKSLGKPLPDKDRVKDMSEEDIQKEATFWHEYPFWESYILEGGE